MAHELTFDTFGQAKFAYNASAKPWHGYGLELEDNAGVHDTAKQIGIDFEVSLTPVYTDIGGQPVLVPNRYALAKLDGSKVFDIASNRYNPVQNAQVCDIMADYATALGARLETLGSLKDDSIIFGLINLGNEFSILNSDDTIKPYLLVTHRHEVGFKLIAQLTSVRVVCNNTLSMALGDKDAHKVTWSHKNTFNEAAKRYIQSELGLYTKQTEKFMQFAEAASVTAITDKQAEYAIIDLFGDHKKPLDEQSRTVSKVLDLYHGGQIAGELQTVKGTAWGLLNSVTEYIDHHAEERGVPRVASAWYGQASRTKVQAVELVYNLLSNAA